MKASDKRHAREVVGEAFNHLAQRDSDPDVRAVLVSPWPASMSKKYAKQIGEEDVMGFHAVACREWARLGKVWKREDGY